MAEAHSVAALSVSLTREGVSLSYDEELLAEIWHSFLRAYKKRVARFKNDFHTGMFPANVYTMSIVVLVFSLCSALHYDLSFGAIRFVQHSVFGFFFVKGIFSELLSLISCGIFVWFIIIQILRLSLKFILLYKGWLYETTGSVSTFSKLWLSLLHLISRCSPMLHSFQGALPHLPLPRLNDTLDKHLDTMRPVCTDEEYLKLAHLTEDFRNGVGRHLQWYLIIKSLLSINYVSDWWEEFVYLRQRSPIMINSNYYGFDTIVTHPTQKQAARAANLSWAALLFRRMIERQEIKPVMFSFLPQYKIPFCTAQYERLFNSSRIPYLKKDQFFHWNDAKHIAVYCSGCWFRLSIHNSKRLYNPSELQKGFEAILNFNATPNHGEDYLASLTAGDRDSWARAREKYFSSGVNSTSLHTIESAAFVVILDEHEVFYDPVDPSKLDFWASSLLHGTGRDRWFDKSLNFIIYKNGRAGINVEHSWGDAPVAAHLMEFCAIKDIVEQGYDENGDTIGKAEQIPKYGRLRWEISPELNTTIINSFQTAHALIEDVEMALLAWTNFGKGLIKKFCVSPDGFLQLVLQLAFYRNQKKFALTYEATTARLFREGRTETVRSCTEHSCNFVRAMLDPDQTREERLRLLRIACDYHQKQYRDAMCGRGIDRHLFALYIVMRFLEQKSPFLEQIFPPTFLLSTSQTPVNQCQEEMKRMKPAQKMKFVTCGGGFGPVADRGYGVSYIIVGEDKLFFHISSKRSADNTSSAALRNDIIRSLKDMSSLLVA